MKKQLQKLLLTAALITATFTLQAQRYLTEVFPNVNVTTNITYANNYTVFPPTAPGFTDLKMDVYQPAGDVLPQRPLVIFMHTGSYLPILINGTPTGSRTDSATVEICKQFARRGYVVANMDYRIGWNPQGTNVDIRRGTLLNAVYRSIQDAKACVRYFRKDAAVSGNIYGIDPNIVILGGQGTGGYIALNYACLEDSAEIWLPKFLSQTTDATYGFTAGASYVNQQVWGDFEGYGGIPLYNNANNSPGYPTDVQFVFNMGGALGDSSWLEAGDAPMVAFHTVGDPFAPFANGTVYVPTAQGPQVVVDVSGSGVVIPKAVQLGNNACFANAGFTDSYTLAANAVNGGAEGLFPFVTNPATQAGPWEWFGYGQGNAFADSSYLVAVAQAGGLPASYGSTAYTNGMLTNPNMTKAKALAYIDTVMNYVNPRIVYCLNLQTGVNNLNSLSTSVNVYPNPAKNYFMVKSTYSKPILSIDVVSVSGAIVKNIVNVNAAEYKIQKSGMSNGMYFIKVNFADNTITQKLVIE